MYKLALALAALLLIPGVAFADDLSTTLAGPDGQGFAVLDTQGGQVSFQIFTNGIGDIQSAVIREGINTFLDLNAASNGPASLGSVNATGGQIASLNANSQSFTLVVTGETGQLTGNLINNGPSDTGGADGGDDSGDGGGDGGDGGGEGGGDGGTPPGSCSVVDNQGTTDCVPGPKTLCLNDGRFEVTTDWTSAQGTSGQGDAITLEGVGDTGLFYFFNPQNIELVVKILDACSFADRFWIFAGGLTNVQVELTVRDTETGETRLCQNPAQTAFQPIQDTNAFATCP